MEKVFTFGFNIVMHLVKCFFSDHGLNFDLFSLLKFMDEIIVRNNKRKIDCEEEKFDYLTRGAITRPEQLDRVPCGPN